MTGFNRSRCEVKHYGGTKSITVLIEYRGELDVDVPSIAREQMALLIGDAWRDYALEQGLEPVKTMAMIDEHTRNERKEKVITFTAQDANGNDLGEMTAKNSPDAWRLCKERWPATHTIVTKEVR